ncbi:MAG TPA: hypothetical protein VL087_02930 [Nitrospirota bacterium]|nr:hypothetical protein [Nitrospirota bacterium]
MGRRKHLFGVWVRITNVLKRNLRTAGGGISERQSIACSKRTVGSFPILAVTYPQQG